MYKLDKNCLCTIFWMLAIYCTVWSCKIPTVYVYFPLQLSSREYYSIYCKQLRLFSEKRIWTDRWRFYQIKASQVSWLISKLPSERSVSIVKLVKLGITLLYYFLHIRKLPFKQKPKAVHTLLLLNPDTINTQQYNKQVK